MVNGIYAASMILHAQLGQIDDGKAVRSVEDALQQLDEALRELGWAAFVRHQAAGA